jgi:hypothetical protein
VVFPYRRSNLIKTGVIVLVGLKTGTACWLVTRSSPGLSTNPKGEGQEVVRRYDF